MRYASLALATFAATLSGAARAEEPADTDDLEGLLDTPVVSAPSKAPETVDVAPATSVSITAEELRRHGIRTIDEAINFMAFGMWTEKRFGVAEVGSRGVLLTSDFGSHVLLVIDGHSVNEQWGAGAYFDRGLGVPIEMIDHIEIVLGPGSVLYGSNAMLGIVHIVTKRAKDFAGAHVGVETLSPFSTRGMVGLGREFRLLDSDAELVVAADYYYRKGPTFDFGPQDMSGEGITRPYDSNPFYQGQPGGVWGGLGDDAHFVHAPSAYARLRIGDVELGTRAALFKRSDPTNSGNFDDASAFEQDRFAHVDLKHSATLSPALRLSTRLYADAYDYHQFWPSNGDEDCLAGMDSGCQWHLRGAAQWVGAEPQLTFDWFEDGRVATLVGFDGRLRHLNSSTTFIDNLDAASSQSVGVYDLDEKAIAAFLQQTAWPMDRLALSAGARLDVDERFGTHPSPRVAVTLLPWDGGSWRAIYSEAFRAPSSFELYYYDPDTQVPGGDQLGAESVRSIEGVIEQRVGAHRVLVGVFSSSWDDIIQQSSLNQAEIDAAFNQGLVNDQDGTYVQLRNATTITSFGGNIAVDGSLASQRLHYGASFTQSVARIEIPGASPDRLPVAPDAFANARISYDIGVDLPTLALAGRFLPARPANNYPSLDEASATVEGRFAISGSVPRHTGLTYRVTFDAATADRAPYVIGPGVLSNGRRELEPRERYGVGFGLQYDFLQ